MTNDFFFIRESGSSALIGSPRSYPLKSFRVWKSTQHSDPKHPAAPDQLSPHSRSLYLTYPPHAEPHRKLPSFLSLHNSPRSWKPARRRESATQSPKPSRM